MTIPDQYSASEVPAKNKAAMNIAGQKFGRLLAISPAGRDRARARLWSCVCDCGASRVVSMYALLRASTISCGGHHAEYAKARFTRHGQAKNGICSRTYASWKSMLARCGNPKNKKWKHYGGRGIKVCEHWLKFDNFFADMGERPANQTLDRKDVNGNYEKSNCRWATASEQARNKRVLNNNLAGAEGVELVGVNRCSARIIIDGKRMYLGCWPRSPEGIQAASEAIKRARQLAEILS